MGVPKFYRWISERYPCLSEVVKEFQLPEFDNLYLDMNGIIHVCSHPNDDDPHFRITEEAIFKNICHYIDFLYRMIKPRKVFFMAVDGVAPRAKMNQQRGRRFRSAREAEDNIKKAQEKGEVLPTEQRFDSNCITPGTPFMVRLQNHLKYFVNDKITHDPLWQGRRIYLSGHETPGEGEHKVMDFIRYSKSQADYDPDTRHCLYGLDADLIMLGLVSHEPRFSLLREEVRFGGRKDKNSKRTMTPEETTFHLLHLSLLRDYLAYEFSDLKGKLPFEWDMEQLIDDWVLMGFLVGNDFIPHLPHLHIHHDALPLLWATYKKVLPTLDGYLNEAGHLNLPRFEKFMIELSKYDTETFESAFSDLSYLESKLGGKSINESVGGASKPQPVKMKKLKPFKVKENGNPFAVLEDSTSGALTSSNVDGLDDDDDDDDDSETEGSSTGDDGDDEDDDYDTFDDEFSLHKRDYYMSKMSYSFVTPEVMKEQAQGYVVAIQWVLLYYFEGCPSWSWFFAHHYAPYISDIRGFSDMKITFDLSKPFLPFQQLMAVLPAASKELLPPALQGLMTEAGSPVLDFYPVDFQTDLNGKQQDWEAVVLIPFIEENRLLSAMASREHLLTKEEAARNTHGPHLLYQWAADTQSFYPSSLPGVFPDIHLSKAQLTEIDKHAFHIDANKLRKGLLDATRLDVYFPGFPTLRFLPHTFGLAKTGVKVFQHASRGDNMVLRVNAPEGLSLQEVAEKLVGKVTFVGWPHLHEAKVFAVADNSHRVELVEDTSKKGKKESDTMCWKPLNDFESQVVVRDADSIKQRLMDRFAIEVGNTEIVVYAKPMTGRSYTFGHQGAITLSKQFASQETAFVYQMTVQDVQVEDAADESLKTLEEVYPVGSPVFMVGNPHYGAQGKVKEVLSDLARVRVVLDVTEELDLSHLSRMATRNDYLSNMAAAQQIGMDGHLMSRITGSIFVESTPPADQLVGHQGGKKVNIGLNLKFTKRGEEVPGYTKKTEKGWSYSWKCVKQVEEYINSFSELWRTIQTMRDEKDIFSEAKLFPQGCSKSLKDVTEYLENLPCTKAPHMPFGSQILDEDKVTEIERRVAALNPVPDMVKMKVKPHLLFRPLANQGTLVPDPAADFQLYDRVVVVKAGYSVPFGQRGTLIGIPSGGEEGLGPHSVYDVVFDKPFVGGISLRCSPGKGYRVPGSAMLNLTFGEFRKKVGPSASSSTTSASSSMYNNNNSVGPGRGVPPHNAWQHNQQQQQHAGNHPGFSRQPVQWDSRGQPMFGKIKKDDSPSTQPQFVTPRVHGAHAAMVNRNTAAVAQDGQRKVDNSEFDNMWKNLQSHQSSKSSSTGKTGGADILKPTTQHGGNMVLAHPPDGNSSPRLLHHPIPQRPTQASISSILQHNSPRSDTLGSAVKQPEESSSDGGVIPASVQNLFANASKAQSQQQQQSQPGAKAAIEASSAGGANEEFLAMFNSLKIQEQSKSGRDTSPKSKADLALKQLLKIGITSGEASNPNPAGSQRDNTSPSATTQSQSSASGGVAGNSGKPEAAYGRQVSLQELFEEANRQQKKQQHEQPAQQPNVKLPSPQQQASAPKQSDIRDPMAELEAYCLTNFKKSDFHFDYKLQPKQNAYIANVMLPNGQRYEGSLCKTKQDAEKSAASMALLCLKTSTAGATHPVITGYMSGTGNRGVQPPIHRFFSPNSAFSPIGIPGSNPQLLPHGARHPPPAAPPTILLTPQHFINQPPPAINPLLQLMQQQQQQKQAMPQSLASMMQHPPPPVVAHPASHSVRGSNTSPASQHTKQQPSPSSDTSTQQSAQSLNQQFIPMQVTKQQKKKSVTEGLTPTSLAQASADGETITVKDSTDVTHAAGIADRQSHTEQGVHPSASLVVGGYSESVQPSLDCDPTQKSEQTVDVSKRSIPGSVGDTGTIPQGTTGGAEGSSTTAGTEMRGEMSVVAQTSTVAAAKPAQQKKKKSRLAANFGQRS